MCEIKMNIESFGYKFELTDKIFIITVDIS